MSSESLISHGLAGLGGFAAGALLAWSWARSRAAGARWQADQLGEQRASLENQLAQLRASLDQEVRTRIEAQTRLEQQERNLAEQRRLLDEAQQKLSDTFKALAGSALQDSQKSFLDLARQTFNTVLAQAKGDLGQRQKDIDALVKPLTETLQRYETNLRQIERARQEAYGQLREQMGQIGSTQQELQRETGNLVQALRTPQVRGRWGELTLRRAVELAGMSRHCDFVEQVSATDESGRLRPDMIVKLPAGQEIVVDAKVPLTGYLEAVEAPDQSSRQTALARHASQVRDHLTKLGSKNYWAQFSPTPDLVVLFLPGECFFSAALECDSDLIEYGMQHRVVLATPTTLITLLRSVAYGWQQEQMTRNAQEVARIAQEFYERIRVFAGHFSDARAGLIRAVTAFDNAVGSLESRVFPSIRRFKQLGVSVKDDVPTIKPIHRTPRDLPLPQSDDTAPSE